MSERLARSLRRAAHAHAVSARGQPADPADLRLNLAEGLQLVDRARAWLPI